MADETPSADLTHAVVDFEVRPDGTVRFEVSGVPGAGCEELEKLLVAALGGEVTAREHTTEFYQAARTGLGSRVASFLKRK